ncbi:MAG: restriction alleviation protein [Bacteriophage sp.]|nr:MAG: restriction alleviation protein [Bacteriophage sp.]
MNETKLLPCPFCGGDPELVDNRVEWFVRCSNCKPFATVIYGNSARHIDHCETDEDSAKAVQEVDWGALKQSAIDAWNRRAPSNCLHQIQEPSSAEQAAWHAGLDEGRAQAPQPDDMRDKVTLALGLSLAPKGAPAFAWSYLLDSIRELVKCEEELVLLKAGMEMSKAAPAAVADARDDSALLDAMEQKRIAVVPEYEGPWDAEIYNDEGKPNHRGSGSTPREAIRSAISAQAQKEQSK